MFIVNIYDISLCVKQIQFSLQINIFCMESLCKVSKWIKEQKYYFCGNKKCVSDF